MLPEAELPHTQHIPPGDTVPRSVPLARGSDTGLCRIKAGASQHPQHHRLHLMLLAAKPSLPFVSIPNTDLSSSTEP